MFEKIGVVGSGVMGSDVALDLALNDLDVFLQDLSEEILKASEVAIRRRYRVVKMMKPDRVRKPLNEVLGRINFTTRYEGFPEADMVIENVTENFETKKCVFSQLTKVCRDNVMYAINTSCISITRIASLVNKKQNVIGMHFMNPAPLKEMVEVVRAYHTSKSAEDTVLAFLKNIGKQPVVVNDFPGFVANRLSHLFMNEAAFLVQDNIAAPEEIDTIFKKGYGHKMGPLETADLIGLDTVVHSLDVLFESYSDPKFRCCPLLRKMVEAGVLGAKSGKGFYDY